MDTTSPPPADQPGAHTGYATRPTGAEQLFDGVRRSGLVRSDERWVGGVAGGLALRLGVDPLVVRGAFGLAAFLGGLGLVLYGIGWALMPEQRDGRIHLQELLRGRFDIAVLGAFVVLATGLSSPDRWVPWWGGWWHGEWWTGLLWVSAVLVVVALVVSSVKDRGAGPSTSLPRPGAVGTGAPPPPAARTYDPSATTAQTATPGPGGPSMDTREMPYPAPSATGQRPGADAGASPADQYAASDQPAGAYRPDQYRPDQHGAQQYGAQHYRPEQYRAEQYRAEQYRAAPVPPPAPRPVRRGPGVTTVGVVVALGLLTLAALMYAQRVGDFAGPVLVTAGAVTVVLAGLAIIVSGLRGRTSGALGGLAVVGILLLVPATAIERSPWAWQGTTTAVGELTHTPQTVAEAESGYALGAGEGHIDLTQVPLGRGVVEVPISVGAGELTVLVPAGAAYTADITVYAGEVVWLGDTVDRGVLGRAAPYRSPAVAGGEEPELLLDISVGAGEVRVVEVA